VARAPARRAGAPAKRQAIAAALAWEIRECEERLEIARRNIDDALEASGTGRPARISLTGKLAFAVRLPVPALLTSLALDLHLLDGDLRRQVMRFYNRLQSADRDVSRNIALPIAERQGGAVGAEVLRVELEQVRAGIERARETIPTLRRQLGHLLSVEENPWLEPATGGSPDTGPSAGTPASRSIYACWWTGETKECRNGHPEPWPEG
jgi:hypothetical protein